MFNFNTTPAEMGDTLPRIKVLGRNPTEISNDCYQALLRSNNPAQIFVRGGMLVRIQWDEKLHPSIQHFTSDILKRRLYEVVDFDDPRFRIRLPVDIPKFILCRESFNEFPPLEGITRVPFITPEGQVFQTKGYDPSSKYFYLPGNDFERITIPTRPGQTEVNNAIALLKEMLSEFPFTGNASFANFLGLLLTVVVLPNIKGLIPIALLDATKPGTGKSLLANIVSIIATGNYAQIHPIPDDEQEWQKLLTSILLEGSLVSVFDNLQVPLESSALSGVVTARIWSARLLGKNSVSHIPQNQIWMITGNNVCLRGDLPRRSYTIRLDAHVSNPWERIFRIQNLLEWVLEKRSELVASLLVISRYWYLEGCPKADLAPFGNFDEWAKTVGGILHHAGIDGFLQNLQEMYQTKDVESQEWESFLLALHNRYKGLKVTVLDICKDLEPSSEIIGLIPSNFPEPLDGAGSFTLKFKSALGSAFRSRDGTRFGSSEVYVKFSGYSGHNKTSLWSFVKGNE